MSNFSLEELQGFIIRAKQRTFAGEAGEVPSQYPGSFDLEYDDGEWRYHDRFFGKQDFIGQEVVLYRETPVWGMAYTARVLDVFVPKADLWSFLKVALLNTYSENRFLGESVFKQGIWEYEDTNQGDTTHFEGKEMIRYDSNLVYELSYFGGLLK